MSSLSGDLISHEQIPAPLVYASDAIQRDLEAGLAHESPPLAI